MTLGLALALCPVSIGATGPLGIGSVAYLASAQASHTRTFSESYLKGLPLTGGYYSCLKQQPPYTFFWQDWYGVKLSYLLDDVIGLQEGTQGVRVYAKDGMSTDLTLDRIRNSNSQGLFTIMAWQKGVQGAPHQEPPLSPLDEAEDGTFRLALGQDPNAGDWASGGTPNFPYFEKWVRTIEVLPLPAGTTLSIQRPFLPARSWSTGTSARSRSTASTRARASQGRILS